MEGMDWIRVIPVVGGLGAIIYLTVQQLYFKDGDKGHVNPGIQKDAEKVVHSFDIEDLGDKQAYCRCWRSKKFPMCDGSHNAHNKATGDNVGPLCLSRKAASS